MKILVLGGTGAMGMPLVFLLKKNIANDIYVVSRSFESIDENVSYLKGNAKDITFLKNLLQNHFDVIIDFMVYNTTEFLERVDILLSNTDQYFFLSSSRVYAQSKFPITENNDRILDVCKDMSYISTDDYALAKAREEDILKATGRNNYTILRPYITINAYCIKLCVFEKENWLNRALAGRTIIFPKDIAKAKTCITYGEDVAASIVGLIHNEKAYGEVFNITSDEVHSWEEILTMYLDAIQKIIGRRPCVQYISNSSDLEMMCNKWQIRYDRLFDRSFDNSKIESVRGKYKYKSTVETINLCINEFIKKPRWSWVDGKFEAWCDCKSGEWTPLKEIPGMKNKIVYLKNRML